VSTRHCDYQSTSPSQDTTNHPMQSVQLPAHKMLIQTKHNTRDGSMCKQYCDILPISILPAVMKVSQNATKCRSEACKNQRKYSGVPNVRIHTGTVVPGPQGCSYNFIHYILDYGCMPAEPQTCSAGEHTALPYIPYLVERRLSGL